MADIELVIKIPEEEYKRLAYIDILKLRKYIENGTPLPKGHGDLIDRSQILTVTDFREYGTERCYVPYVNIEEAETIIEAESEG